MVNIKAIIYISANQGVVTFHNVGDFIKWQIDRRTEQWEKDKYSKWYNVTSKTLERYLEREYDFPQGSLTSALHIFKDHATAPQFLIDVDIREALSDENHIVILEMRVHRRYNVATFYSKHKQFSITIRFDDPIEDGTAMRNMMKMTKPPRHD